MNLKNILVGIEEIKARGEIDLEIDNIANDSRKVLKNALFFAIKGYEQDGTKFIADAIKKGAIAIMVDSETNLKELKISKDITLIVVKILEERWQFVHVIFIKIQPKN